MDWNAAVEKNREALKRIVAMLVAMAGLRGQFTFFPQQGRSTPSLSLAEKSKLSPALTRRLHRAVLKLLRPTEAAVRRLIIVAARGLAVVLPPTRPRKPRPELRRGAGAGVSLAQAQSLSHRLSQLPLLDLLRLPRVRPRPAAGSVPRISLPGFGEPFRIPPPPSADDPVDATRLVRRLAALTAALDDLPAQAQRFARWRTGAAGARDARRPRFRRVWPLKPGRPPGWRRKPVHEVHEILNVVHGLAFWALESPDTS